MSIWNYVGHPSHYVIVVTVSVYLFVLSKMYCHHLVSGSTMLGCKDGIIIHLVSVPEFVFVALPLLSFTTNPRNQNIYLGLVIGVSVNLNLGQ
jgi:hypothetical protein